MDDDALAEADEAALNLLRLYDALGVPALVVTYSDAIYVRCQQAADVVPLCKRVVEEYATPKDRTLN